MIRSLLCPLAFMTCALPLAALAQDPPDDLEIEVESDAPVTPEPTPPPAVDEALLARLSALEGRLAELEAPPPPEPAVQRKWYQALDLRVSGYIQTQLEIHQLSVDEIDPDGDPLNQDRFVVRRGRIRVDRHWKYAHADIEIDANTVRGPFLSLRRAEAALVLPHPDAGKLPYVQVIAGLGEIPFGFELRQGNAERWFMERTVGSLAFFRGEPDTGLRVSSALGPLRFDAAVQNGVPLDDRPGAVTQTFTRKKTFVGRLGFDSTSDKLAFSGGVSALEGTGFSSGNPATKASLAWRDLNQDGLVTLNELVPVTSQAATPSSTFRRWALNADLEFGFRTGLGWTRAYGEVTMASNLDRGLFVADPIATGYDLRETAYTAAVTQEISSFGLAGFRVESYNPDSDLFEARRGLNVPVNSTISTLTPIIGARIDGLGRFVFQYDYVADQLGRDDKGEPADLPNDNWTFRLQVEF